MGNDYIVSIERDSFLSIDTGRLKIKFANSEQVHFVAVVDIAAVILSSYQITITNGVLKALSEVGAIVVCVDTSFMPTSITLPIAKNLKGSGRPYLQAKNIDSDFNKTLWNQIIKSKISGQISVLRAINIAQANYLEKFLVQIQNGDKKNIESFCARIYWEHYFKYFHSNNVREKTGATDVINSSLNYGYAIVRSIVARNLATTGLNLNLGIWHSRKDNPFNLVEDFIEPFRYIVDKIVLKLLKDSNYENLNKELKNKIIIEIVKQEINLFDKQYRLFQGIDKVIYSYCKCLENNTSTLILPNIKLTKNLNDIEINYIKYET
ncbi:MAG: type II CRISPR-associated endonuclease Cas1 [Elusimicrobia bacterium]|nr:type II CRISPR-associated endonuclease Cas1 [Elusimicrobiota bacterium]